MKEDYLWDKTGNDPEIEKLENALKAFRQKDTTPPEIPASRVIPVKSESPRRKIFPFAFAFAASITFVLILAGVWFQISNGISSSEDKLAKNSPQDASEVAKVKTIETQTEIPVQVEEKPIVKTSENPGELKRPNKVTTKKPYKHKIRLNRNVKIAKKQKRTVPAKMELAELTDEEKYAYNQLMLALSITSEKLNLVKDKVRGEVKEEISIKKKIKDRSN